jgi:hypothetical protein
MWTDKQIELAAAAAAEKANGGKFNDPLFYAPEHQKFWREVIRTALQATVTPPASKQADPLTQKEVEDFSEHCVYIRSVYLFAVRIWRDCNAEEIAAMNAVAPLIFTDFAQLLSEYLVIAACRITDAAVDSRRNENEAEALAGMPHREVIHPPPEHRIDQVYHPFSPSSCL